MTDTPAQLPATAPDAKAQPAAARKPWHAPTLTQVALIMTGFASGQFLDGDGSTAQSPG